MNQSTTSKVLASRVKFEVTAEIIKNACKENSRHCMIAQAVAATLPHVRNISVDMMTIRWSDPERGWRYIYLTPKPAQYALVDYDMGLKIEPFTFQVRSGHATPMYLGTGKQRKRAHQVRANKILKVSDKTIVCSIGRDSVPMTPRDPKDKILGETIIQPATQNRRGRPKEWHPSHNSLRRFGMQGFTEGYTKIV